MIRVIIRGNWAPYVGTGYCDALGTYESLEDARIDAEDYAYGLWEGPQEDDGIEDEGPDYYTEEYDPIVHDGYRAGGGSFLDDFEKGETVV